MHQFCKNAKGAEYNCGESARSAMLKIVHGGKVRCTGRSYDKYGRLVASCVTDDGHKVDVGSELVRQGWALAYRAYSGKYVRVENDARMSRRGAWDGSFLEPWDFRPMHRRELFRAHAK
jgi:endonuclease YncB( thermonuclease family)